jgi:tetratricopeptide (TPR) repeat protein
VLSRVWLALCEIELDRVDEAQRHLAEALEIADGADHPFSQILTLAGQGSVALLVGDLAGATEALERALALDRVANVPVLFPLVAPPLGLAYARTGRHEDGIALAIEGIERAEAIELAANHALRLVWLGEAHLLAGQHDLAKRAASRALETARRYGERGHEAYALNLLGDIIVRGNPPDRAGAEEAYRDALAVAEPLGMRRLAAALTLSRLP